MWLWCGWCVAQGDDEVCEIFIGTTLCVLDLVRLEVRACYAVLFGR
jgi:hypothetical protein